MQFTANTFFFFNDTATTEIYTLSLHDALPICADQIANAMTHERIRYAVAPSEASGLADSSIDLVCVAQALHWFDRPRFYDEVRRVLKARGLLAVFGYSWFYVSTEIDPLVDECLL